MTYTMFVLLQLKERLTEKWFLGPLTFVVLSKKGQDLQFFSLQGSVPGNIAASILLLLLLSLERTNKSFTF